MPWRRCRGRHLWRERIAPPYAFQEEWYSADLWPTDVTGIGLWWRPEELASYTDGQAVNEWLDFNGALRSGEQSDATRRGHAALAQQNGWSAVLFDGNQQCLRFPSEGVLTDWTVMIVSRPLSLTNALNFQLCFSDGAGTHQGGTLAPFAPGTGAVYDPAEPLTDTYLHATTEAAAWNLTTWHRTGVRRNGTPLALGAIQGSLLPMVWDSVGAVPNIDHYGFHGYIGEVAYWNRTTTADETAGVEAFLQQKWALA